jgi:hypothetical protein
MEPKPHVCSPPTPWPLANPPDRQLALVRAAYAYAPAARTRAAALYSRACLPALTSKAAVFFVFASHVAVHPSRPAAHHRLLVGSLLGDLSASRTSTRW